MLIDQPVPNLFGGVSQQPALSRFPNQLEAAVNAIADPVLGLDKRPPTEHIKKLVSGLASKRPAVIPIKRDENNRYIALVLDGTIRVFDITDGSEKTVTNPSPAYLDTEGSSADALRALTVADYTFLLNREVAVTRLEDYTAPTRPQEALIFVRAGNYGRTYTVTVKDAGGTTIGSASYSAPDGSSASQSDEVDTAYICAQLDAALTLTGFTKVRSGSILYISHPSTNFTVTVEDGQGKQMLKAYKGEVQRFTDLPEVAHEGFTIKVVGDPASNLDDYWVRYNGKTWEETIAPGSDLKLDALTMPHALVRNPDETFEVIQLPLVDRTCGDDDTNPFPSFTDQKLRSLFLFKNRLGFLADENVITSKSGDYFNFFRTTVTDLLADDPIDVAVEDTSGDGSEVSILENAVAFEENLLLFGRTAQYSFQSVNGPLSPTTAEAVPVTSYETSSECRPVAYGKLVAFVFNREGASGLREMNAETVTRRKDAPEITAHVPTYLPGNLRQLAASSLENILIAVPESGNKLYAYEFLWTPDNSEKLQSAWGRWDFHANDDILAFHFFGNVGYLVIARADGYHLERLRFTPELKDASLPYFTRLDRRCTPTATYDNITDRTTFTVPWPVTVNMQLVTGYSSGALHAPGDQVPIISAAGYSVLVAGNKTAWNIIAGVPYTLSWSPTRPVYVHPSSVGTVANNEAELKVKYYSLDYQGTGYFKVIFSPAYRGEYEKTFSGAILGATPTDVPSLSEGSFRISTPCSALYWNLTIENDSPFPSRFLSAAWAAVTASRSRRV